MNTPFSKSISQPPPLRRGVPVACVGDGGFTTHQRGCGRAVCAKARPVAADRLCSLSKAARGVGTHRGADAAPRRASVTARAPCSEPRPAPCVGKRCRAAQISVGENGSGACATALACCIQIQPECVAERQGAGALFGRRRSISAAAAACTCKRAGNHTTAHSDPRVQGSIAVARCMGQSHLGTSASLAAEARARYRRDVV